MVHFECLGRKPSHKHESFDILSTEVGGVGAESGRFSWAVRDAGSSEQSRGRNGEVYSCGSSMGKELRNLNCTLDEK